MTKLVKINKRCGWNTTNLPNVGTQDSRPDIYVALARDENRAAQGSDQAAGLFSPGEVPLARPYDHA